MRAILAESFGDPEVLRLTDVARPAPGPGEILVRVHAAGLNPADWKIRKGLVPRLGPPPIIPGLDYSGVVAGLGPGVDAFSVGDEVFGALLTTRGAYAEYTAAPADTASRKPAALDHVTAASLPIAGLTAWQALHGVARLRSGQRVLVHAAAGGIGHLAVQIAKAAGAHVIGTASAANHDFLREIGVDEAIDYRTEDFTERARDVDVVLDTIGGDYGPRSLTVLRPGGILLAISGSGSETRVTEEDAAALGLRYREFGVTPSARDLDQLTELMVSGAVRVNVERTFPLEHAADAHRFGEAGHVRGKAVLTVG